MYDFTNRRKDMISFGISALVIFLEEGDSSQAVFTFAACESV